MSVILRRMSPFSLFKRPELPTPKQVSEYKKLCIEASHLLAKGGKNVPAFADENRLLFRHQAAAPRVLEILRSWVDVLAAGSAANELHDDKKMIWRILQRLRYKPNADMLDHVDEGDTVEIYTTDNWQIYRNLKFFDYLDVSVDEICNFFWHTDSKRDTSISLEGLKIVFLLKTRQLKKTFLIQSMPLHYVTCNLSGKIQKLEISMKMASPLSDKSGVCAYIVTNKAKRIN